jgi:uncharacterized protein (DUF2062 family)/predicted RNA methylase
MMGANRPMSATGEDISVAASGPEGGSRAAPPSGGSRRSWLRRLYMTLRTEHRTPAKVAFGVGIGVFVGCSPLWGLHFALSVLLATIFRLNRMIVYAGANVGNPLTAAPILFAELQIGHRLLRGMWLSVTIADVETLGVSGFVANVVVGSIVVGAGLGALIGVAAWAIARASSHHESYREIVDAIVVRYVDVSIRDAEAARSQLLRDPVFPFLIGEGVLGSGARVLDLGCGRGLVGALVGMFAPNAKTSWYLGIDLCDRYVRAARQALDDLPRCDVQAMDLRDFDPPAADVVIINDVLRYLPFGAQDALLRRVARALPAGARVFVREKNAGGGWRFMVASLGDALVSFVPGRPRHGAHYRRAEDLRNAIVAAGFAASDRALARPASPAWLLLEGVRRPVSAGRA